MSKTRLLLSALAVCAWFGSAGSAAAHSMWLTEKAGGLEVQYGHENALDPYKPDRVIDIRALSASGTPLPPMVQRSETAVTVGIKDVALVSATYDNKIWTKSAARGWVNQSRSEVPDGSQSGQSIKFTKVYLAPLRDFIKPAGQALEIVPQADPASLKAGDRLRVQILLNGKPLAGAKVATNMFDYTSSAEEATTDGNGIVTATVPVGRSMAGVEIEYFAKSPPGSMTDGTWYTASITFRIAR